jgi:CRP-like cAMP-binding protein
MLVLEYSEEEAKELFMMLKKDPILGNISLSELFELLELSTMVQYDPGEYIIKQGEYDTQLFILISGNMEIIHNDKTIKILEKTGEKVLTSNCLN